MRDGFARCVDWSIAMVTGGAEKLRAAEKAAKEKKLRIWKDYKPSTTQVRSLLYTSVHAIGVVYINQFGFFSNLVQRTNSLLEKLLRLSTLML